MKKLIIKNRGMAMNLFRLIVSFLIISSLCTAQTDIYNLREKIIEKHSLTDSVILKSIINKIISSVQNGRVDRINRYLAAGLKVNKTINVAASQISPLFLKTDNIDIKISGNDALAEFSIFNTQTKAEINETMTFARTLGVWEITNSTFLINTILRQTTVYEPSSTKTDKEKTEKSFFNKLQSNYALTNTTSSAEYYVTAFILSNSALIRRHTIFTPQNSNISNINLSLVKTRFNDSHIFKAIKEGKFAYLSGGDILGVIADSGWNRFIYGSHNFGLIKAYGNNNEQCLPWASSVGLDKFGNVLVLAGYPPKVFKFLYDELTGTMNFANTITLSYVQEATDICMDDNFSPENQSDDTFWLTDKKGNAIFNFTLDGNFPVGKTGRYTRIVNAAGIEVAFNKPTRIIANYGTHTEGQNRNLAIIDSDKKRFIIIDDIINNTNNTTGFQGNTIYAEYTVVNFTGQTNVSLNAIGYTPSYWSQAANGLWVADPNNGMFHIFDGGDMHSGYLGSVKSISLNGTPEWSSPKSLVSTAMSNSGENIWAFVTMDKYDDTHGINTYYPGADMVNIVASPNSLSGEVDITASFINYSIIQSINIYNSGGTLIWVYVVYSG